MHFQVLILLQVICLNLESTQHDPREATIPFIFRSGNPRSESSLTFRVPSVWNTFPARRRSWPTLQTFKRALKSSCRSMHCDVINSLLSLFLCLSLQSHAFPYSNAIEANSKITTFIYPSWQPKGIVTKLYLKAIHCICVYAFPVNIMWCCFVFIESRIVNVSLNLIFSIRTVDDYMCYDDYVMIILFW